MNIDIANLVVGIAGLVVGVAGIYFTVLSSPAAMKALGSVLSHTGLPPEFKGREGGGGRGGGGGICRRRERKGFSGAITIFTVLLLILVSYVFLFSGLVAVFGMLFRVFGFQAVNKMAFLLVLWINILAMSITFNIFKIEVDLEVGNYIVAAWAMAILITIAAV